MQGLAGVEPQLGASVRVADEEIPLPRLEGLTGALKRDYGAGAVQGMGGWSATRERVCRGWQSRHCQVQFGHLRLS